jgi:uncharacterized protein (TIGR02118 family)
MIKVSILYPYRENGKFDVEYYCRTHMPLAARLFGAALKGSLVDIGINAGPPGMPPTRCSPTFRTTPAAVTARS